MKATQERLHELFDYDPCTGAMTRRVARPKAPAGSIVGYLGNKGYLRVCVDREYCEVHRVVWKWLYGTDPAQVDHRNRVRHDNRQDNLRVANGTQNQGNRTLSGNTSGFKGVSRTRNGRRWRATLGAKHLGTFDVPEDAAACYRAAAALHFGEEFVHAP